MYAVSISPRLSKAVHSILFLLSSSYGVKKVFKLIWSYFYAKHLPCTVENIPHTQKYDEHLNSCCFPNMTSLPQGGANTTRFHLQITVINYDATIIVWCITTPTLRKRVTFSSRFLLSHVDLSHSGHSMRIYTAGLKVLLLCIAVVVTVASIERGMILQVGIITYYLLFE